VSQRTCDDEEEGGEEKEELKREQGKDNLRCDSSFRCSLCFFDREKRNFNAAGPLRLREDIDAGQEEEEEKEREEEGKFLVS